MAGCRHTIDDARYKLCSRCRAYHRTRARARRPRRQTLRDKALAWLATAPRTAPQIAQLIGVTPRHAACMLWQLRRRGKVTMERTWPRRYRAA